MVLTLERRLERAEAHLVPAPPHPTLDRLRHDPLAVMTLAGLCPDPWQVELLQSSSRVPVLLNCSRQSGKSTVSAALALRTALTEAGALVLLLSPSLRQSAELFRKVADLYGLLGRPVPLLRSRDNALKMELANGSRVISLPGDECTVRGFSAVRLLVIDEAARVDESLYAAVRPMLAVSGGRLVVLSTPNGRQGWFWDAWRGEATWNRVKITAEQCPRISREFLAQERKDIGERWYAQEYMGEFMDMIGAVFSGADIDALLTVPVDAMRFPT